MGMVDDDSAIASLTESLDVARPTLPPNFKLSPIQVIVAVILLLVLLHF
jgi:hypothetical protein